MDKNEPIESLSVSGKVLNLRKDKVRLPNGKISEEIWSI